MVVRNAEVQDLMTQQGHVTLSRFPFSSLPGLFPPEHKVTLSLSKNLMYTGFLRNNQYDTQAGQKHIIALKVIAIKIGLSPEHILVDGHHVLQKVHNSTVKPINARVVKNFSSPIIIIISPESEAPSLVSRTFHTSARESSQPCCSSHESLQSCCSITS